MYTEKELEENAESLRTILKSLEDGCKRTEAKLHAVLKRAQGKIIDNMLGKDDEDEEQDE